MRRLILQYSVVLMLFREEEGSDPKERTLVVCHLGKCEFLRYSSLLDGCTRFLSTVSSINFLSVLSLSLFLFLFERRYIREINLDRRKHQSKVEANAGEQSKGVTRSGENLSDLTLKSFENK